MRIQYAASAATAIVCASVAQAQEFAVIGGGTSVLLDTATLSSAASLDLSGVAGDTVAPGELGAASVQFPINARNAASLPTTFRYDTGLGAFSGAIEHTGTVLFNDDTVEVGNFTIGFDAARATGNNSGFFVESTAGIAAILFDVEAPSALTADGSGLQITANLLVSPEFSTFLNDNGLATADLTGADVGDAFVNAAIPAPGAAGLMGVAGVLASRRRR